MENKILKKPEISFCIVNYNTTDYVLSLIDSIEETCNDIIKEILVFDNASNDNPHRILKKHSSVNLVLNRENIFFTQADNYLTKKANGKFIISINPDTIVRPFAIRNMLDFMYKNTDVGAVTPKFVFQDGKIQSSFTPFLTFKKTFSDILNFKNIFLDDSGSNIGPVFYNPELTQEAEVLYGACILFREEVIHTVGLKDEKFVHGWDEYDWCLRIKQKGWKLFYIHNAIIEHFRSVTIKEINKQPQKKSIVDKHSKNGYYYYQRKHFGFLAYIILRTSWMVRLIIIKFFKLLQEIKKTG